MESQLDYHTALAWLEWQVELGADEAIGETPVDRFNAPEPVPAATAPVAAPAVKADDIDPVVEARQAAARADSLDALRAEMESFAHCDLHRGARSFVFSDGNPAARLMIVGEAPGRDEDLQGKPFVGRAGQLLDRMFEAIGMGRDSPDAQQALYITNILPWRPPQNRDPEPGEIAMLLPFLQRHVALVQPEILVLMGNISCQAVLGRKGITRLRGEWAQGFDLPVMPMFHPAYLLRNPQAKRDAWADLLAIQARLNTATG